jgi:hypothetical protein
MDSQEKKELTTVKVKQDNILCKLKNLAKEKEYGTFTAEIKIHNGHITEVRYKDFVGVIR